MVRQRLWLLPSTAQRSGRHGSAPLHLLMGAPGRFPMLPDGPPYRPDSSPEWH